MKLRVMFIDACDNYCFNASNSHRRDRGDHYYLVDLDLKICLKILEIFGFNVKMEKTEFAVPTCIQVFLSYIVNL